MRHATYAFFLVLTVAVAACGTPEPSAVPASSGRPSAPSGAASTPPAAAVHDGRAIEITANDTLRFNATEIRAKAGECLSVTLVNAGSMPKFSMGHNWLLLAGGTDVDGFVASAAEALATNYVPASRGGDILAATKLLGPKERDTVTFDAPTPPGRYDYLCSFPGHYQAGMHGVLIVE